MVAELIELHTCFKNVSQFRDQIDYSETDVFDNDDTDDIRNI